MPKPKTQAEIDADRAATKAALDKLYALQPPRPKQKLSDIAKPSMAQNYQTLGQGMMRGARRMFEQRKIIADEQPEKK